MSPDERDFEGFSRRLDDEWLRERLRTTLPALVAAQEEDELVRELGRADPLAGVDQTAESAGRGFLAAIREALLPWPARLAVAGATCALVLVGLLLGRATTRGPGAPGVTSLPPKPAYQAEPSAGLGVGARVKPESERKYREAMAYHAAPDFARRALPLLREAVAADATNDRAQFWLGVALLLEGKKAEAVAPLEAAARLAPADMPAKQYLLFAYLATGASDKALALQGELLRRP